MMAERVETSDGVFINSEILRTYGCKNCVWKFDGSCPNGFTKDGESTESGYCDKLVGFLSTFIEKGDSVTAIHEKYNLHLQTAQAMSDHYTYNKLIRDLRELKESGNASRDEIDELQMKINAYKMWWNRLSEQVIKYAGKVNDRVARKNDKDINVNHTIDLSQLHSLMNNAKNAKSLDNDTKKLDSKIIEMKKSD